MKVEISSAADFLMNLLRVRQQENSLTETQLHSFRGSLITILHEKFRNHWYIENPRKGSGFRCIRVNTEISDPCIAKAANNCCISTRVIRDLLPQEITLWIDPTTVSYRIGENGSISVLYDANRASPANSLDSSESSEERCEISPEINKLVLDLYEKSNNSVITKPKRYLKNRPTNNSPPKYYHSFYHQHHYHQSPSNNHYYQNKAF
ncbi:protein BTG2-like [Chironomus tepperi]|uniref:protein BTG2-like n=1 Tax=Chironomus tepperi TaxID=113505 RepID=UPI00391F8605